MEIERELAQHHLATLRAIETGRVELAERRLKAYVQFARAFLDATTARGIDFSFEASRSVSMMDWRTPSLIIQHAYDGILAALRSGNHELIFIATTIPLDFMEMSVEKKDFLFYRRMSQIYPSILATSYSVDVKSEKELIVDRSWRLLHEFARYFLPKLTVKHDEEIRKQFASELMWRFGDLMKIAVDHNDPLTFALIGREMDSLFHDLEIFGLTQEDASALEASTDQERLLIWFGFGAWILRSFVSEGMQPEPGYPNPRLVESVHIPTFFDVISKRFSNIRQLANVYVHSLAREYSRSIWQSWLMDTLPEGQVHIIDTIKWLTYFYAVMGIRLSKTSNLVAADIPEPARDFEFHMKDIQSNIANIKAEPRRWAVLIPQLAMTKLGEKVDNIFWEYFLSANDTAVQEWNRLRADEIIASPIDPKRIREFEEQCLDGWSQSSWLTKVFSDMGKVVQKQADAGVTYWAVDVLVPKEAFIESQETHFFGLGREPTVTLGRDTTTSLLSLVDSRGQDSGASNLDNVITRTSEIASSISLGTSSLVIFLNGSFELERKFLTKEGFSPRWMQKNPRFTFSEYIGDMDDIPVFFIYNKVSSYVTVVDLMRVGRIVWHLPVDNNVGGLLVRVTAIDEAEAVRIIEKQPKFLEKADGSTLTREAAVRNLMLKVRIFVGVKIELEIESEDAIKKISVQ